MTERPAYGRSPFSMEGRVALVTGAAGLLGMEISDALARQGAHTALLDLPSTEVRNLASSIEERHGVMALGVTCDMRAPAEVVHAIELVERDLGPIDMLVNNAATKGSDIRAFFAPAESYELDTWRDVMAVNLEALFVATRDIGARMIDRGGGTIVNIASIYGVMGVDDRVYEGSHYLGGTINTPPVYAASKSAVVGLTRYFATRWAGRGVRVNCISPGGIESGQNPTFISKYSARVPMGRMGVPREIADVVVFLGSDASSYMTGQNIMVDGGLSAW